MDSKRGLPAYRVNESYRFNAAELLEWANSNPVQPPQSLIEGAGEPPAAFTLAGALQAGGGAGLAWSAKVGLLMSASIGKIDDKVGGRLKEILAAFKQKMGYGAKA